MNFVEKKLVVDDIMALQAHSIQVLCTKHPWNLAVRETLSLISAFSLPEETQ